MARLFGLEVSTEEFIKAFGECALDRFSDSEILPSLIICQALVESSGQSTSGQWLPGLSEVARKCYNYHGLNYYGDSVTKGYAHETITTMQERDGKLVESEEQFCRFGGIRQELDCLYAWYGRRDTERQRKYYGALPGCRSAAKNFENIRLAGFATDSSYTKRLQAMYDAWPVIRDFDDRALNPQPVKKHYYFVQAGAFRQKLYAQDWMKRIRAKGFPAYSKEEGGYYKVQTGAFQEKAYAQSQAEALEAAGFPAFIAEGDITE